MAMGAGVPVQALGAPGRGSYPRPVSPISRSSAWEKRL